MITEVHDYIHGQKLNLFKGSSILIDFSLKILCYTQNSALICIVLRETKKEK